MGGMVLLKESAVENKELLIKFMVYLLNSQGTDFVGEDGEDISGYGDDEIFSSDEMKSLMLASKLASKRQSEQ